ncbi:MAG: hypothetical protein ACKOBD_11425 [Chloroflexota bacterium]
MSSEALAKPIITRNSSEFKLDAYASIPAGELVVFAVQVLQADAAPVAVEEVVSTCFRLFPHSFALKNYFYWPDSALVTRRLHDAKEKGLLKGNPSDGYETKLQGKQIARHVAKTLGVSLPVPPKAEAPIPPVLETPKVEEVVEKKVEEKKEVAPSAPVVKAVKKQEIRKKEDKKKPAKKAIEKKQAKKTASKKQAVKTKKEVVTPVKKKSTPKPKVQPKTAPKKTVKPAEKTKAQVKQKPSKPTLKPKTTAVKKPVVKVEKKEERKKKDVVKAAPKQKAEKVVEKKRETSKKKAQSTVKPEVKKVELKVDKKKAKASAQPTQLTMQLAPPTAWKKAQVSASKPKVKEAAPSTGDKKPVKGEVLVPVAVSKEEKDKAAKVIKQIERSDAYQLYRRNGRRAQIGEFDFRNMLFATMESSAETLKRNTELFKRYASIHFRTDLIAFLEFCEENFSALLISKVKGKK